MEDSVIEKAIPIKGWTLSVQWTSNTNIPRIQWICAWLNGGNQLCIYGLKCEGRCFKSVIRHFFVIELSTLKPDRLQTNFCNWTSVDNQWRSYVTNGWLHCNYAKVRYIYNKTLCRRFKVHPAPCAPLSLSNPSQMLHYFSAFGLPLGISKFYKTTWVSHAIHWLWVHPVSTAFGIIIGKGCLVRKRPRSP